MKADTRLTSVARIGEKRKMEEGGEGLGRKGWEGRGYERARDGEKRVVGDGGTK